MTVPDRTKVLVADDEEGARDVLKVLIATEPGMELIGSAHDAETAIELAARTRPDVALLDVRMPGGGGSRAAREIVRRSPSTKVIALSAYEDLGTVLEMLQAGAHAFVAKSDPAEEIMGAIHRAVADRRHGSEDVSTPIVSAIAEHREHRRPEHRRRLQRERIERILEDRAFTMVFQPIFDLDTHEVAGMEALARFTGLPHRGPNAWIAEADAVGLLAEVEIALVRAALGDLGRLPADAYIAVNVSPATAISDRLRELLQDHEAGRIVLEMTEHTPIDDYDTMRQGLATLRERGIRFSMDDAGAGFASLRHIVRLEPDFIKLDITLTRQIERDPVRQALVVALTSFAKQIGATIIAEAVETERQLDALRRVGIRFAQGFHLGVPGSSASSC